MDLSLIFNCYTFVLTLCVVNFICWFVKLYRQTSLRSLMSLRPNIKTEIVASVLFNGISHYDDSATFDLDFGRNFDLDI